MQNRAFYRAYKSLRDMGNKPKDAYYGLIMARRNITRKIKDIIEWDKKNGN